MCRPTRNSTSSSFTTKLAGTVSVVPSHVPIISLQSVQQSDQEVPLQLASGVLSNSAVSTSSQHEAIEAASTTSAFDNIANRSSYPAMNRNLQFVERLTSYQRLALFVKVMIRCIERYETDKVFAARLIHKIKHTIELCRKVHPNNHHTNTSERNNNEEMLQESILVHLRSVVTNPYHWNMTRDHLGYSCD